MEKAEDIFVIPSKQAKIDNLDEQQTPDLFNYLNSAKLETLHTLRISGNSYSSEFCETLQSYLKKAPCLKCCDFNDIFVGRKEDSIPQSLISLMTGVMFEGKLEKIDLSNNAISKNGAEAIAPFLAKQNTLKVFLISNCGLGIAGVSVIADALKQGTPELEVLAIARNRVENDGALKLAEAIKNFPKLKEIHIYQNFIQEKGMHALMTSLQCCKDLEIIDIRDNYLKRTAAEAFAELLQKSHKLKGINISDCNLEAKENEIVIKALEQSSLKLQKIGYNYNELDDKNGKALIDSIISKTKLIERFDIKGNDFGKQTKKYFQEKMQEINCQNALSKFDSDDEDEQELIKTFSDLKI